MVADRSVYVFMPFFKKPRIAFMAYHFKGVIYFTAPVKSLVRTFIITGRGMDLRKHIVIMRVS